MRLHFLGPLLIAIIPMSAAELDVTKVILYKHGIGYFERAGFVDVTVREFIPDILQHITGRKPR